VKVSRFPIARMTHWLLTHWLRRWPVVLAMLVLALGLTGCVEYDVGIHFDNPHRGAIVQRLQINDRLRGLSEGAVQEWVGTLERRSRSVGGSVRREADQVLITIPFGSAMELETKFNRFFAATTDPAASPDLPAIESHLTVNHSNFLLLEHDRLRYDLDLRSLGVSSSSGSLLLSPGALIDLGFRLETPWGARSLQSATTLRPEAGQPGLTWNLIPGQVNHLEAVFWLPSPLGIGAMAIVILVVVGRYLKYPQASQGHTDPLLDRQPDRQSAP
jgi:Protein of unknown function (DUF3153)